MASDQDKKDRQAFDQIREDQLWKQINAAHARKAQAKKEPEIDQGAAMDQFFEGSSELDAAADQVGPAGQPDQIRDFINSLYKGDELSEQRDPGHLRQPHLKKTEAAFDKSVKPSVSWEESAEIANDPSGEPEIKEKAEGRADKSGIRPLRLNLNLDLGKAQARRLNELGDDLAKDLEAEFLNQEAALEESAREFEAMIEAVEKRQDSKIEPGQKADTDLESSTQAGDAFIDRMPDFSEDGRAIVATEQKLIGSELLKQHEIEAKLDQLADQTEAGHEQLEGQGFRPFKLTENVSKKLTNSPEQGTSDSKLEADDQVASDGPEHPLISEYGPSLIRGPKAMTVETSNNLIAKQEAERRGQVDLEFIEALSPPKQASIDQTVRKLQSGALAPPFYVPRLPRQASSFSEALEFARRLHPLPGEMQLKQQPTHRTWLLAQLNHCSTQERLSRFAFSLNYEDLALLFPALASLKRGRHIERLLSIILMRASHYLYLQGWITLQYAYPRSTVEKGLSELCMVLDDSTFAGGESLGRLERDCLDRLNFGDQQFIWPMVRRISEIALPNQRHFLTKIVAYIQEKGQSPEQFYREFAIYPDLPLAKAIQSSWAMNALDERVQAGSFSPRQLFD